MLVHVVMLSNQAYPIVLGRFTLLVINDIMQFWLGMLGNNLRS